MQSVYPEFTVVLPTLNAASHLEKAVASLQAQTLEAWELIIVDGGSEDGTAAIADRLAAEDTRIAFMQEEGASLYRSVFLGFDRARAEKLCWMGADDLYPPWGLACAVDHLSRPGIDWIMGQRGLWDANAVLRVIYPSLPAPRWLIRNGAFNDRCLGSLQAESVFFNKVLFAGLCPERRTEIEGLSLAGDHHLWRAFAATAKLNIVPTVLGGFRLSGVNRSVVNREAYEREVAAPLPFRWPHRLAAMLRQLLSPLAGYHLHRLSMRENGRLNGETAE